MAKVKEHSMNKVIDNRDKNALAKGIHIDDIPNGTVFMCSFFENEKPDPTLYVKIKEFYSGKQFLVSVGHPNFGDFGGTNGRITWSDIEVFNYTPVEIEVNVVRNL